MKKIFGNNLKKMRNRLHWTQGKAAAQIGVGRPAYGAWEEGRSFPNQSDLISVARVYNITDLVGFIENEQFDPKDQSFKSGMHDKLAEDLLRKYKSIDVRARLAVNILLGIVDVDS